MRILNVRFKNLKSLRGEWNIDFTDPAYSDGLFAITGPAGAGKSAILDAICLALYGRTPRAENAREMDGLMSRQAEECFAEVVFETAPRDEEEAPNEEKALNEEKILNKERSRYRAFWGQVMASGKPDGVLRPPRREIAGIETGTEKILETRPREVAEKIEEVTGLNFDRFARSVMLARGAFSAFLRSGPGGRSPILEELAGTEIYGRIPALAHEIRDEARSALAEFEAVAAEFQPLAPEERRQLEADLAEWSRNEAGTEKELERCNSGVEWLESMAELQKELNVLEERRRELTRREEAFEPDRKRLERAQRALEFGSAYASLIALRKEQETEKRELLETQAKMSNLEADVRRSEEALQLAAAAHSERQTEQKNALDLTRRVREMDAKRAEKDAPIQEAQAAAAELARSAEDLRVKLEADQLRLENAQVRMRDVQKFLQRNSVDERLIEQLPGIRARFDALAAALGKRLRMDEERAALEKQKQDMQTLLSDQSALYETIKAKYAATEGNVRKLRASLEETLGTRPLAEWRETLSELAERGLRQERIGKILESRADCLSERGRIKERSGALEQAQKENEQETAKRREKVKALEKEVGHFEVQADLIRRIKELEEARHRLRDGEPCPLCGAVAHPYAASDEIPREGEVLSALLHAKENLQKAGAALSESLRKKARYEQEAFQLEEEDARCVAQTRALEAQLAEGLAELDLVLPMDDDPLGNLRRQRQSTEDILQKTRIAVERAEKIEKDRQMAGEELETIRNERDRLALSQQEVEFRRDSVAREWKRMAQEIRVHGEDLKNIQLDLVHQIFPLGFKTLPDERPEQILSILETRSQKWQEQHRLRLELEKQIAVWERDLHQGRSVLDALNLEIKDKNETVRKLRAEKEAILQQRASVFGDKDPAREEAVRASAAEAARQQVESRRKAREAAQREFSNMSVRLENLGRTIHIRSDTLQKADIAFGRHLIANDFKNEDAYLAACLPEPERKAMQERARAISAERTDIDARRSDRKFGLEELRRKRPAADVGVASLDEARDRRERLTAERRNLRQSIESLRLRLQDDEDFSRKKRERLAAAERQRRECEDWDRLSGLFSSSGGQGDRGLARSLTFKMVLYHANRQLRTMADRYRLVADDARPLELRVVNGSRPGGSEFLYAFEAEPHAFDMARPAESLSEGENFVVSLALSLGLSQMLSRGGAPFKTVRGDSLFLDERSGSLPDTAFAALASLCREGKTIGVISHTEALKGRIGTRIEVVPREEGRSVIRAPGCAGRTGGAEAGE